MLGFRGFFVYPLVGSSCRFVSRSYLTTIVAFYTTLYPTFPNVIFVIDSS